MPLDRLRGVVHMTEIRMRMLVLGAGLQGSACAWDLLQNESVERVVLADRRTDQLAPFLEPWRDDPRLERIALDARDDQAVRAAMHGLDAVLNALPYYFNRRISDIAIESGRHCCDLGGNTEIVFEQIEGDAAAKAAGVSVVPDCGLAPGMVNILAGAGIRALDDVEIVRIYVGGLPRHPTPPLDYQVVYSLEGVIDYYTTPSWVVRNGTRTEVEALSEVEPVDFAEPVGTLEAFHTAGGLSTMAFTYEGRVNTMEYKTLRYPGHADIMRAIRGLGLLELDPVRVGEQTVVPRSLFIRCAEPRLRRPQAPDLVALRVVVEGTREGARTRVEWELIDGHDDETGISAMARCTGFSLSITGQMQAAGNILAGVHTPDVAIDADRYISALAERGVRIRRLPDTLPVE